MKTITILAEQVSDSALAAALPPRGIASVAISRADSADRVPSSTGERQSFRNPVRFAPGFRIELLVDESAVETVFDGISFAYGAGLFSDAEVWAEAPEMALSA